ncbi:S-glutathionyl-(chloro)hydroquinone reductase [Rhizoclosmatium sp. JEL0117]|nr:S-glutathionyl-(chloro)hydroquinone reductase [Rhizoclosmatium sp. JEL0117]
MATTTAIPDAKLYKWASPDGEFRRQVSSFRDTVSKTGRFQPEAGRYHLYISHACPWAHRTHLVRNLKGLEHVIGLSVVDYLMTPEGWHFSTPEETPGCIPDDVNNAKYIKEIYFKANAEYSGRFTVPVLWDKKEQTIVNNESSEIIRMLNSEFNDFATNPSLDLYPTAHAAEIDSINSWIYDQINNGVYKSGFATTQEAYEKNVEILFEGLDRVELRLKESDSKWLVGEQLTEADIRLFTTIVRFDPVYHGHFKCNKKTISHDYPYLLKWLRRVYQISKVKETINLEHIKKHYYMSHIQINPSKVVPVWNGPVLDSPIIE